MPGLASIRSLSVALAVAAALATCTPDRPPERGRSGEPTANPEAPGGSVQGPGTGDPGAEDPFRWQLAPPRFEDFPAGEAWAGRPAQVDLTSHPKARLFRTALERGAASGPNFAGRYTLVAWGCGTMCSEFMIVDAGTGRVYEGLTEPVAPRFSLESRLLVFDAPEAPEGEAACGGCTEAYYLWHGGRLELIPPETWVSSAPPPPSAVELLATARREEDARLALARIAVAAGESGPGDSAGPGESATPEGQAPEGGPIPSPAGGPGAILAGLTPGPSRPTWDRLLVRGRNGSRFLFDDEVSGGELRRTHVFRVYVETLDAYAIERIYMPEGGHFFLVDAGTTAVTEIDGEPYPSPDGRRFVTASLDLVAGHRPNRLRVYRMETDGPVLEWEVEPRDWGPQATAWRDPATIVLERAALDTTTTPFGLVTTLVTLRREGGSWALGGAGR